MPRHSDPLLSFDVPRDWENRSVVAFAAPPQEGAGVANLVITRDRMKEEEELVDYAERHLDELERCMDGFAFLGHKEEKVDERPAVTVSFRSRGAAGMLAQRVTLVELPDRAVAAITVTAPESDVEQLAPLFERILSSVRWAK